jgi:hypothetical protein
MTALAAPVVGPELITAGRHMTEKAEKNQDPHRPTLPASGRKGAGPVLGTRVNLLAGRVGTWYCGACEPPSSH